MKWGRGRKTWGECGRKDELLGLQLVWTGCVHVEGLNLEQTYKLIE